MTAAALATTTPTPAQKRKPILCLDFDGVIHSYSSGWHGADVCDDPPVSGAMAFILTAVSDFDVQIYSSRSGQPGGIEAMQGYIDRHLAAHLVEREKLAPLAALDQADVVAYHELKFPNEKPAAFITIDDRAIQFDGTWPEMGALLAFKPWNKR